MSTALTNDPKVWNSEHGQFINENHRRFAEIVDGKVVRVWREVV